MRGGRRVRSFRESRRDLAIRVHVVWLPMFPRFVERSALPDVTEEFGGRRIRRYTAGEHVVGWGSSVAATQDELFDRLESIVDR